MGWDDNGLPTERRVQNYFGVRCDPSLPYDPDFDAARQAGQAARSRSSRPNFVELCERLTADRRAGVRGAVAAARAVGRLVADLHDDRRGRPARVAARVPPQPRPRRGVPGRGAHALGRRLPHRGRAGRARGPRAAGGVRTGCASAASTARPTSSSRPPGPELIPACVALVAHPDDARYRDRFGDEVTTPLFGVRVPVLAHRLADPEKGTGIAMICTFGDVTDVVWWRELRLPTRSVMGRDGRLVPDPPNWEASDPDAEARYRELGGKTVKQARERVVELLQRVGRLEGEPEPITHPVKFYERGDRPLEIVTTRQWYIRNGGQRSRAARRRCSSGAASCAGIPPHMRARYESWVEGLNARLAHQPPALLRRAVPGLVPARRRRRARLRRTRCSPREDQLPVDPSSDAPDGYDDDQRGKPGGFVGDPDVMDTWATSSLTPQIGTRLGGRPRPVRPHVPDGPAPARRATSSARGCSPPSLRSHFEHGTLPWSDTTINGWILDPDRKKMSKSKGNVVTPMELLRPVRLRRRALLGAERAAGRRHRLRRGPDEGRPPARDQDPQRVEVRARRDRRRRADRRGHRAARPVDARDRSPTLVDDATGAFEGYDYARALERTERFFWGFCDDYLELVKQRAYGAGDERGARSARRALELALVDAAAAVRAAPAVRHRRGVVVVAGRLGPPRRVARPGAAARGDRRRRSSDVRRRRRRAGRDPQGEDVAAAVAAHRGRSRAVVRDTAERLAALERVRSDDVQRRRARRGDLDLVPADEFAVEVELADPTRPDVGHRRRPGLARRPRQPRVDGAPARRGPARHRARRSIASGHSSSCSGRRSSSTR